MTMELKVNGRTRTVDVPGDMPLLWVIRDALDLVGTRFGCGMAQCGARTVHLNGADGNGRAGVPARRARALQRAPRGDGRARALAPALEERLPVSVSLADA